MSNRTLDTSAIMAILLDERGCDVAARLAPGAMLCSVNLTEVVTKCIEKDVPPLIALNYVRNSDIAIVDFDGEAAVLAGELFKITKKGILSLGDRACIATAIEHNATIVTADRAWATLDLPCPIELIR